MTIVSSGQSCSTSATTNATATGNSTATANTTANTTCCPTRQALYTVAVANQVMVITPTISRTAALLTLGWSAVFAHDSCLYGALPGASFKMWGEGGKYHVKLGKRESVYRLVSMQ